MLPKFLRKIDKPAVICLYAALCGRLVSPPIKNDVGYRWKIEIKLMGLKGRRIVIDGIHKDWLVDVGFNSTMNCQVYYLLLGPNGEKGRIYDELGIDFVTDNPKNVVTQRDEIDMREEALKEQKLMIERGESELLKKHAKQKEILREKLQNPMDRRRPDDGNSDQQ